MSLPTHKSLILHVSFSLLLALQTLPEHWQANKSYGDEHTMGDLLLQLMKISGFF